MSVPLASSDLERRDVFVECSATACHFGPLHLLFTPVYWRIISCTQCLCSDAVTLLLVFTCLHPC